MKDIDDILQDMKDIDDNIPEDKDCKKCSYSENGVSRGMVTPCFDFCQGLGLGGIYLGDEHEKQFEEDEKWVVEMRSKGLSGPEIAEKYKARCEKRRNK